MFSIDSKDFTIASAARITVRDYSNFDCCGSCEEAEAAEAETAA